MRLLTVCFVGNLLSLKPHRLLDRGKLPVGDRRRAFADRVGNWLLGYEGVHEATAQCLGGALKNS